MSEVRNPSSTPTETAASESGDLRRTLALIRELSKSGIVTLVVISVLAGYLIGQPQEKGLDWGRLALTLVGILLLASGSSALNQLQEIDLDARMPRTAKRPLPSGRVTQSMATLFVVFGLVAGLGVLACVTWPVFWLGISAVIFYNGLYTLWWKKHWAYAAVPGAIPGALPILMGFAAAADVVWTPAGIYLFAILFYWQMPHFWVLALRFREDYAQGDFPTLPVARGEGVTVVQIGIWGTAYVLLALMAPLFIPVSTWYWAIAIPTSLMTLYELGRFVRSKETSRPGSKTWLRFFLWVNFSLLLYLGGAALDVWKHVIMTPIWTR